MALKKRLLRVTLKLPSGDVVWDESLMLAVKVTKAALAIQSKATIDVGGLSQNSREALLTQFTAWAKRQREQGDTGDLDNFVDVEISAGYLDNGVSTLAPIFVGQVVLCEPLSGPPNVVVRVTCYTKQINRAQFLLTAPERCTFKQYCEWAAQQMGLKAEVNTSIDETIVENPGRTIYSVAALLPDIQRYDRQNIAAFIDNDTMYVLDIGEVAKASTVVNVDQFVGTPLWSEWGVDFTTMFNPLIRLAHGVQLNSKLNPAVNQAALVVMKIEYNLQSRNNPFTMACETAPSAGEPNVNENSGV